MTPRGPDIPGRSLHPGTARAPLVVLDEPLSFWGGVDASGTVVDEHHPHVGTSLTGCVVAMPSGRGSSSSTAVLAELIRSGHGPAALLLAECDTILVIGALVAAEIYGVELPIVQVPAQTMAGLRAGAVVEVRSRTAPMDATVRLESP